MSVRQRTEVQEVLRRGIGLVGLMLGYDGSKRPRSARSLHATASDTRPWLEEWGATVRAADWASINMVRSDYPSADGVKLRSKNVVTVFNVKGNEYRLLTAITYSARAVVVPDMLTHGDYNKNAWKLRY